jgi:four helix bundle protein
MPGIRKHEDLIAWQLSEEMKEQIFAFTARPAVACDEDFCDDIRRSARSAPANLAEGFARYWPRENARFVRYALGSLAESRNHLLDALKERHITQQEFNHMSRLARRATGAATRWHQYLMSCPPGDPTPWLRDYKG